MSTIIQALKAYTRTPIGATDVVIPLKYLKDSRGNFITAMPAGATLIYGTIEPQSQVNQEAISFTGIQDDGNNKVSLTGVTRNLNPQPPYTALSPTVAHGNNIEIILSNTPAFYNTFMQTNEDLTVTGKYTYTKSPDVPTPTAPANATNKAYIDALDALVVHKTGNETINNVKTFTNSPKVPNPTLAQDAVNYSTLLSVAMNGVQNSLSDFTVIYDQYKRVSRVSDNVKEKTYFFTYSLPTDTIPTTVSDGQETVLVSYNGTLLANGRNI